ncbi:MAG: nitroreductase family protein [Devosia sp.]
MTDISLTQVLKQRRTVRDFSEKAITLEALNRLIWAAQGVTGDDGKRTAPSAHALHPLRLLVVVNNVSSLEKGLYEVSTADGSLKKTNALDVRNSLQETSIGAPKWITDAACIVVICADMATPAQAFAEQKPYGLRGARYVYIEAGAAAQNLQLQSTAEGLGSVWVGGFDDEATANALCLQAPLSPIILLCVGHPQASDRKP